MFRDTQGNEKGRRTSRRVIEGGIPLEVFRKV